LAIVPCGACRSLGIVHLGVALHQDATWRCSRTACWAAADRARPADGDRRDHAGKQHDVAHRHDDDFVVRQRTE